MRPTFSTGETAVYGAVFDTRQGRKIGVAWTTNPEVIARLCTVRASAAKGCGAAGAGSGAGAAGAGRTSAGEGAPSVTIAYGGLVWRPDQNKRGRPESFMQDVLKNAAMGRLQRRPLLLTLPASVDLSNPYVGRAFLQRLLSSWKVCAKGRLREPLELNGKLETKPWRRPAGTKRSKKTKDKEIIQSRVSAFKMQVANAQERVGALPASAFECVDPVPVRTVDAATAVTKPAAKATAELETVGVLRLPVTTGKDCFVLAMSTGDGKQVLVEVPTEAFVDYVVPDKAGAGRLRGRARTPVRKGTLKTRAEMLAAAGAGAATGVC
jgi:hypothetical protein